MVSDTASGTIASFTDGSDVLPAKSVLVTLNPKQSGTGTPSPSNIRPISGWDEVETHKVGKNLFDKAATDTDKGYVSGRYVRSTDGATVNLATASVSEYISVKGGTQYVVSPVSGSNPSVCFYDNNKEFISGVAYGGATDKDFSTPSNAEYLRFSITNANLDITQLELGSTATDYEPYDGHTYTTDLPQTVYGGTLDVVSGVLTVDRAMVTIDGSATSPRFGEVNQADTADGTLYVAYINHTAFGMANSDVNTISDKYAFKDLSLSSLHIGEFNARGGYSRFVLSDQSITTLNALNAYLADNQIQLVYTLATPTTIQCDPQTVQTLIGDNNVWGGNGVSIDYYADTKLYIEKMLGA